MAISVIPSAGLANTLSFVAINSLQQTTTPTDNDSTATYNSGLIVYTPSNSNLPTTQGTSYGVVSSPSANLINQSTGFQSIYGTYNIPFVNASSNTGAYPNLYGTINQVRRNNPNDYANSSSVMAGTYNNVVHQTSLANTAVTATMYATFNNFNIVTGAAINTYSTYSSFNIGASAGYSANVTNYYGNYVGSQTVGSSSGNTSTITNYYGVYLSTPTVNATGAITNRYGIYQADSSARNYFAGYLGIGTSSPSYTLDVNGTFIARANSNFYQPTSNTSLVLTYETNNPSSVRTTQTQLSTGGFFWNNDAGSNGSNDYFAWQINGLEQIRLTGTGLGIGTSSPSSALYVKRTSGNSGIYTDYNGTNVGRLEAASNGNLYMGLTTGGGIVSLGVTSNANAVVLDSSGNLLVGQTSKSQTTVGAYLASDGSTSSCMSASTSGTTTWNTYSTGAGAFRFYVDMGGTIHATSSVITAISDQRLKENVRDIDTGLDAIMALKPRRFDWKEGKGQDKKNAAGFIAQEFETVFPECVSTSKAGDDGIEYKNINHETLIPTLVKAIQELKAELDIVKTELAALKS